MYKLIDRTFQIRPFIKKLKSVANTRMSDATPVGNSSLKKYLEKANAKNE
jgi:hypothetical protein